MQREEVSRIALLMISARLALDRRTFWLELQPVSAKRNKRDDFSTKSTRAGAYRSNRQIIPGTCRVPRWLEPDANHKLRMRRKGFSGVQYFQIVVN